MNHAPTPSGLRRWARIVLLSLGLGFVGLVAVVASTFTLSRDAAWLRRELAVRDEAQWSTRFQVDGGPVLLGSLRTLLRFHEDVQPEVRQALAAIRRLSVGVYSLNTVEAGEAWETPLPSGRDGWTRLVSVRNANTTVWVYVRDPDGGAQTVRVAVAVRDGSNVVVASGVIAPEALVSLATSRI
jgi:hypothetical protein